MFRVLFAVVVSAAALGLAGCEPLETELTLNADGSGTLTQRGRLSPSARMMLLQGWRLAQPYRTVLQPEPIKDWNAGNPDAGVKVVVFDAKAEENGQMPFRLEATFESLEKLTACIWGQSLQLGVEEAGGTLKLRCDDPLRFIVNATAMREMRREDRPASARRAVEFQAMMEMLVTGLKGTKVRTVLKLPVPAVGVEGAALSEDRRQVVYEAVVGETLEAVEGWLKTPAMVVTLPAGYAGLRAFAPPAAPTQPNFGPTASAKPAPAAPAKVGEGFSARLNQINWSVNRYIQVEGGGNAEPQRNENLSLSFGLYGPERPNILRQDTHYRHDQTPPHVVTTAKDNEGNDLRPDNRQYIWVHTYGGGFGDTFQRPKDQPFGNVSVNLKTPGKEAKTLAKIEGYVVLTQVAEVGTLEVKPVKENLEKEYVLGAQTIRFLSVKDRTIEYALTVQELPVQVKWLGPDEKVLPTLSQNQSTSQNKTTVTQHFKEPLPENVSAVVTYAAKVEPVKVPFSYENLRLP